MEQETGSVRPRVLFVCLGNICRSPMAEGTFRHLARADSLNDIDIDSAGTSDFHLGNPPDRRAQATLRSKGIDISHLRARQVMREDFHRFDYVLAMDNMNLGDLQRLAPPDYRGVVSLFMDFAPEAGAREVPDPYFGRDDGFEHVFQLIEAASRGLLRRIRPDYSSAAALSSPGLRKS